MRKKHRDEFWKYLTDINVQLERLRRDLQEVRKYAIAVSKDTEAILDLQQRDPNYITIEDHRLAMDAKDAQIRASEERVQSLLRMYEHEDNPGELVTAGGA